MSDKAQEEIEDSSEDGFPLRHPRHQKKQRTLKVVVSKPLTNAERDFAAAVPAFLGRAADIQKDLLPLRRSMRTRYALNILRCVCLHVVGLFNPHGFVLRKTSDNDLSEGYVVYEKEAYGAYQRSGWHKRKKPLPVLELCLAPQKKGLGLFAVSRAENHEISSIDNVGLLVDDQASVFDAVQLNNLYYTALGVVETAYKEKACLVEVPTRQVQAVNFFWKRQPDDGGPIESFFLEADAIAEKIQPERQKIYIRYASDLIAAACEIVVAHQPAERKLRAHQHRSSRRPTPDPILRGVGSSVTEGTNLLLDMRVWPTLYGVEILSSQDETRQRVSHVLDIMDHTPAKLREKALLHLFRTVFCGINKCSIEVDTPPEGTSIEKALPKGTESLQKGLGSPYLIEKPSASRKKQAPAGAAL